VSGPRACGAALLAIAALVSANVLASGSAAQPSVPPPPTRCVAGTRTPQPEASLGTIRVAPPPPLRTSEATENLEHPHAEGELLVFPAERGTALLAQDAQWQQLFDSLGALGAHLALEIPFYRVRFPPSDRLHDKVDRLRTYPQVRSVHANGCVFPAGVTPDDPEYKSKNQWALERIQMGDAWAIEKGEAQVVVAVIDSAFDHTNPDLVTRQWLNLCEQDNGVNDPCSWEAADAPADDIHGWNFYHDNDVLTDAIPHGTMVAGIIGAEPDNGELIAGINYDVRLMDLKIFHSGVGYHHSALRAFAYAVGHGARVINASWVSSGIPPGLETKIDEAAAKGIVVVAAAGQGGAGSDLDLYAVYPCSFDKPNLICVTSTTLSYVTPTTPADVLETGSNFGQTRVHVGAPGEGIKSTMGGSTGSGSGTSMATPHVSGVAALLRAHCPNASASWILGRLQSGPSVLGAKTKNGKRLDALAALSSDCPSFEFRPLLGRAGRWFRPVLPPWWKPRPRWPPPPEPVPPLPPGPGPDPPPPER
jgi:hypothetical protein